MSDKRKGTDLFIVDNADSEWKVRDYLHDWAYLAHTFDVATGYFEIGALLALDGQWQKLDHMRILMGMRCPSDPRERSWRESGSGHVLGDFLSRLPPRQCVHV